MGKILVTGALGQLGSELTPKLRQKHGREAVIASDIRQDANINEPFEVIDVTKEQQLVNVIQEHDIDTIFHFAAILSAAGEKHLEEAYQVNINGLHNILEAGRKNGLDKIIIPSSIAVFGPETPSNPSETTILSPTTMYGVSKVLTEHFGRYYRQKHDLDIRGVRFPGILSHRTKPGGGTTDYAVEAFYEAVQTGEYSYFVRKDTKLPMMYMPDAISALMGIADAEETDLRYQCEYNVGSLSFTPERLTAEIKKQVPEFQVTYEPDERQKIADSWPNTIDDTAARQDWGWSPDYGLAETVEEMVANLERKMK